MHRTPFFAKLVTFVLLTLSGHFLVEHWIQQNVEPVTSAVVYQAAGRLKSANSVPIAVLDIGQFYEEKVLRGGKPDRPLNADEFGEILGLFEQMSANGHKPLAIGFDIDFSSSETELDRKLHNDRAHARVSHAKGTSCFSTSDDGSWLTWGLVKSLRFLATIFARLA